MDWKQVGINLLVMVIVYTVCYVSSYFFSKKYAIKKKKREDNEKQK